MNEKGLGHVLTLSTTKYARHVRRVFLHWPSEPQEKSLDATEMLLSSYLQRFTGTRRLTIWGDSAQRPLSPLSHGRFLGAVRKTLAWSRFEKLEHLDIQLPLPQDYDRVVTGDESYLGEVKSTMSDLMAHLRRLEVSLCPRSSCDNESILDSTKWLESSEPMRQQRMFSFVSMAPYLTSLSLIGEHLHLDLNTLEMSNLCNLRDLFLRKLKFSFKELWALIHRYKDTLRNLRLDWMKLSNRSWYLLIGSLADLPLLTYFYMERCTYDTSALDLKIPLNELGWVDSRQFELCTAEDTRALAPLKEHMTETRRRLGMRESSLIGLEIRSFGEILHDMYEE